MKYMTKIVDGLEENVIPEKDGDYWLITDGEVEIIVRVYTNPDTKEFGIGFNIADGGGFLPMSDLCDMSYFAGPIDKPE